MRRPTATTTLAAAALVLAACGTTDEAETPDDLPEDEQPPSTEELDDEAAEDAAEDPATPEDPLAGLPDLSEQVEDGVFRGEGIVLPIPDGWQFEPAAQLQGQILATEGDEGTQAIGGLAVDVDDLPEPVTFEELLASYREQVDAEPAVDEEIELQGAEVAHQLRYDALPAGEDGQPGSTVLLIAADGDGRLGLFNYAAATDDFEDAVAERFVTETGFDPDSDPTPLQLPEIEGESEVEPELEPEVEPEG